LLAIKSSAVMTPADSRAARKASIDGEGHESIIAPRDRRRKRELSGFVLVLFLSPRYGPRMTDAPERLTPATPEDLADALAFALRFDGRKRKHDAAEMMARIVAKRLVEHLERSRFVVMKRPPIGGSAPPYRGEVAS
jgi:hypothetical protein